MACAKYEVIQETYNWSCQEETKGTCRNRTEEECKKFAGRAEDGICWSRGHIINNGIESLGWVFKVDDDACGYCGSRYFYNVQSQGSSNPSQEHYPAIGNDLPLKPGCPEVAGKIDVAACLDQSDACVAAGLEIVESSSKQKLCLDSNGNAVHERFCANAKDISCADEPKTFKARFIANGAQIQDGSTYTTSSVTKECSGQTGCNVTAPNIIRDGFNIRGWSTSSNATIGNVDANETITLSGNVTYYAITDKTVTGTFVKGEGVASVGKTSATCVIRNRATSCDISPMPTVTCQTNYNDPTWNPSHLNGLTDNATSTATCKQIQQADPKCGSKFLSCENGSLKTFSDDSKYYEKYNPENLRKDKGDYIGEGYFLNFGGCTKESKCTLISAIWGCENNSKTIYCKGCNYDLINIYPKKIIEVDEYGDPLNPSENLSCNLGYDIEYIPMSCTYSKKENGSIYLQLRMLDDKGEKQEYLRGYDDTYIPPSFRISFGENCEQYISFEKDNIGLKLNTIDYYICEESSQGRQNNRIYFENEDKFDDRYIIIDDLYTSLSYDDASGHLYGGEWIWGQNTSLKHGYLSSFHFAGLYGGALGNLKDRPELNNNHQLRFDTLYRNINNNRIKKVLYIYSLPELCELDK